MPAVLANGTLVLRSVDPDTGFVVTNYLDPRSFERVSAPTYHLQRRVPSGDRSEARFADDEYDEPCPEPT